MLLTATAGCCAAYNLYNLGGAHGHIRHPNLLSFVTEVKNRISGARAVVYYAFSNGGQSKEREYLTEIGFETKRLGSIHISTITGTNLRKFFAESPVFEEERKKEVERKAAQAKAEAEARERARRAAEERRVRRENHVNKDGSKPRKRGELRVGDTIHRYRTNTNHMWSENGIVEEVGTGYVIISGNRINNPTFNNGNGGHTVERIPPKTYNRIRWW